MTQVTAMAGDRAGLLVRVSSGGQDEQNQAPDVQDYAASKGYRTSDRFTYTLHDKSAYHGEQQTALDQIVSDMKAGLIKVLVCWHSDRLDRRGVLEALSFLRQVKDAGGRVESVQEGPLDERNLITVIGSYMNHEKSAHLSQQVQLAHNRIKDNGAFRGRDPFGYQITGPKYDKKLVIIENLRPVIIEIFDRVIAGESLLDVCTWLDSLKVKRSKTTTKKYDAGDVTPWWPAMLMRLIRHPAYSGRYYVQRTDENGKLTTYTHSCEAIITRSIQRQAIQAMSSREKRGPRGNPETRAMLKGVISCPDCDDSPMYRSVGRRSEVSYRCFGRGPQRKGCGNMVPMATVDNAVNKAFAESFAYPVTSVVLIKGKDWEDEMDAVRTERAELPDDDDYDERHAALTAELKRLKSLPAADDELREVELDQLWSDAYAAVPHWERGAWLKAQGFRVTASKTAVTIYRMLQPGLTVPLVLTELG